MTQIEKDKDKLAIWIAFFHLFYFTKTGFSVPQYAFSKTVTVNILNEIAWHAIAENK